MKRFLVFVFMISFILGVSAISYADAGVSQSEEIGEYRLGIGNKFVRGVKNVLFGWGEIPKGMIDVTTESNNAAWGVLSGGFKGTVKAIVKTASGVCDMVTAPISPDSEPFINPEIDIP